MLSLVIEKDLLVLGLAWKFWWAIQLRRVE